MTKHYTLNNTKKAVAGNEDIEHQHAFLCHHGAVNDSALTVIVWVTADLELRTARWVGPLLHLKASRHQNFPPKRLRLRRAPDSALEGKDGVEVRARETSLNISGICWMKHSHAGRCSGCCTLETFWQ